METDKKYFDAACVFGVASAVQLFIPWPLDSLLFPGAVAFWFVQSGQSNSVMDYAFDKAKPLVGNARSLLTSLIGGKSKTGDTEQQ